MQIFVNKCWYSHHPLRWMLLPFTLLYQFITTLRRIYLQRFCQQRFSVPVVVVGNLTVGGVGKTPLVIALACEFQARGLRVGIVSRGYGASISHFPHEVSNTDTAQMVGDEPLLLVKKANCPVVIAPKRTEAVQYLLEHHGSQIIISDDGLQHYAMGRAIEIVVIDGLRGLGNGMCLPSGPLRESKRRLKTVDFLVVNGGERLGAYRMDLKPGEIKQLTTGNVLARNDLKGPVAAVAAIGHPQRFFETLKEMNLEFTEYPFNDHHCFTSDEFMLPEKLVVMTEKDAVKCESFATDDMYVLPVEAVVSDKFWDALWLHKQLQGLR